MKLAFINDTDYRENIGCRLTSSSFKRTLKESIRQVHENGFTVRSITRANGWSDHSVAAVLYLPWIKFLSNMRRSSEKSYLNWLRMMAKREYGKNNLHAACRSDLALFQPEGTIHNDSDFLQVFKFLSLPLLLLFLNKPLIVANGTLPCFHKSDRRYKILSFVLKKSEYSALRDRISAEHYGTHFLPDAAFAWQIKPGVRPELNNHPKKYMLITTSPYFDKKKNVELLRKALLFCDALRLCPLIMTKRSEDWNEFIGDIEERRGAFVADASLTYAAKYLEKTLLHCGGRYHMAIFSLLHSVPSFLFESNTHKNEWLIRDFSGVHAAPPLDLEHKDWLAKVRTRYQDALNHGQIIDFEVRGFRDIYYQELDALSRTVKRSTTDKIQTPLAVNEYELRSLITLLRWRDLSVVLMVLRNKLKSGSKRLLLLRF